VAEQFGLYPGSVTSSFGDPWRGRIEGILS
jgi:hypothetical protein